MRTSFRFLFLFLAACTSLKYAAVDDAPTLPAASDASADADLTSPFEVVRSRPEGAQLSSVWGVDDDNLFAAGSDGVKYWAVDGVWVHTVIAAGRDYAQVWGTKKSDVYAVGELRGDHSGVIEHFDGQSWTDEYLPPTPVYSIWGNKDVVLAVGPGGYLYGKKTGTTDWGQRGRITEPDVPNFVGVAGNGRDDLTLVAENRIYHTNNYGDFPWFEPSVDRSIRFVTAWADEGNQTNVFVGMNHLGMAWVYSPSAFPKELVPEAGTIEPDASLEDLRVVVLHRDDSVPSSEGAFLRGIAGQGTKRWFVGDLGRVYEFDLAMAETKELESGTRDTLAGAWASKTSLWVVGQHELVLKMPLP